MAMLRSGTRDVYLKTLHVFGRHPAKADTVLADSGASQIHAAIAWSGQAWEITDFSRNGTFLDDIRLTPNLKTPLRSGQTIRYGLDGRCAWQVVDLGAPCPLLVPRSAAGRAIAIGACQLLPDAERPQASIHYAAPGRWIFDDEHGTRILADGDVIEVGGHTWHLSLPAPPGALTAVRALASAAPAPSFDFQVSQNEEHIRLLLACGGEQVDLGERTHHYSLLTLARRRYADHQRGLDASSQGWLGVEQLSKMLGIEPNYLNIQLFRARGQIMGWQSERRALPDVIERRRGEVRLSAYPFKITRGLQLEAHFDGHHGILANAHPAERLAC